MAFSEASSLGDRFTQALKVLDAVAPRRRRVGRSYSGFTKALRRCAGHLFPRVEEHLRRSLETIAASSWMIRGWIVFVVDGTRFDCPRTRANERFFGKGGRNGCGPQMLLTTLWHMGTGLPWGWRIGKACASERDHLRQMKHLLPPMALLVADAGFAGYDLLCELHRRGVSFLLRVGGNVHLLEDLAPIVQRRGDLVYLWPATARRRGNPPLVLRLIVVKTRGGFVYLVTNVLKTTRLPRRDAAMFYRMRWGVEVFHRAVKQTLERRKMRSQAPLQARLELASTIIGITLLGLMSVGQIIRRRIDPLRWSPAASLRTVRLALLPGNWTLRRLNSCLGRALKDNYQRRRSKAARDWPHKKNDPPPGPPRLRAATALEHRCAKALTTQLNAG